jgi:phospholipid/cholesterol/gamma-HCH transport system substrate-binding protein
MTRRLVSRFARCAVILAVAVGLAGCGVGYKQLPLPGSKVRGDTYEVRAVFDQALNLAQGAQVRVNGVSVGRVKSVEAKNYQALVTMAVRRGTEIPDDSTARLRYDTPLGELIIQVTPGGSAHNLADGDQFQLEKSTTAPTVEDSLSAASTLINGGNLGQLETIAQELNAALGGREDEIRHSTEQLNVFLKDANASTGDLTRSLEALRAVSVVLDDQRGTIRKALDDIGPAADTLGENTDEIVTLLKRARDMARTGDRIVGEVDDPLLQILGQLGPIADAVLSTQPELHPGLVNLQKVAAQLQRTVPSDTLPLFSTIHLNQTQVTGLTTKQKSQTAVAKASRPVTSQLLGNKAPSLLSDTVKKITGILKSAPTAAASGQKPLLPNLGGLLGGGR